MPFAIWVFSRTPRLRMPRNASQQSSGLAYCPSAIEASRSRTQSASAATVTAPRMMSECPPIYLVAAWIEMSTPWRNGWKKWMPQVLSIMTFAPWAWATAASAGTSCTSKVWLPGLSRNSTAVSGRIEASRASGAAIGS